jgi:hypothetical protein
MNDRARKSLGPLPVHPPTCVANGGHPDKSKLDWATEILAGVIRKTGENPDAPFTTEALQAAAMVEEQELTTFLRYRRNLKERHIPITELDEGPWWEAQPIPRLEIVIRDRGMNAERGAELRTANPCAGGGESPGLSLTSSGRMPNCGRDFGAASPRQSPRHTGHARSRDRYHSQERRFAQRC